ncbi:hypothetical protein [Reyranella sp.]|uniref:hypothetical protein n=1 Tax=Reyranella sp. TaxID=1929291 RepID=UPI003BAB06BD
MPDSIHLQNDADGVRTPNAVRPAGLPIFSTEPLTEAEQQQLLDLQWRCQSAALQIDLCLRIDRVDVALDTLQSVSSDVGIRATEIALRLGSNR